MPVNFLRLVVVVIMAVVAEEHEVVVLHDLEWKFMSCSQVKKSVNLLTWLLIGCSSSCAANQEPACLLTPLLTMTTTHKFPSQAKHPVGDDDHGVEAELDLLEKQVDHPDAILEFL